MSPLTETELPNAIREFFKQTLVQFKEIGFQVYENQGSFNLKLSDEPILKKDHLKSRHGRCWFKKAGWLKAYWPYADSPGVYLFFTGNRTACYVGKSETGIGYRASAHAGSPGPEGKYPNCEFLDADYTISVPFDDAPFLAPALESYLLSQYEFKYNNKLTGTK